MRDNDGTELTRSQLESRMQRANIRALNEWYGAFIADGNIPRSQWEPFLNTWGVWTLNKCWELAAAELR